MSSRTAAPTRLPGLDVLRGVAIALVMLRHGWPHTFGGSGVVGVVAFFTLSGYLITGVLLTQLESEKHVRFGRFYRNRILRLYPALLVMLVPVILIMMHLGGSAAGARRSFLVGAFYLSDIPWISLGMYGLLTHLWTLAIEEQFYLFWPILLLVAHRRKVMHLLFIGLGAVMAVTATMMLRNHWADPKHLYAMPSSWALSLLVGAAAFVYRDRIQPIVVWPMVATAGIILMVLCRPDLKAHHLTYVLGAPVIGVCTVVVILWSMRFTRVWGPFDLLRRLGLISYAVYLWDLPMQVLVSRNVHGTLGSILAAVAAVALACASWWTIERPIARLRQRWERRETDPRPVLVE